MKKFNVLMKTTAVSSGFIFQHLSRDILLKEDRTQHYDNKQMQKKIIWIEEQKFSYPGFQGILFSDSPRQSVTPQIKWPKKSLFESETIV